MKARVNFHQQVKRQKKKKKKKMISLTVFNLDAGSSLFGQGFPCLQKKRFKATIDAVC
jgi:hypothetical protein